jgi:hypothetical protein
LGFWSTLARCWHNKSSISNSLGSKDQRVLLRTCTATETTTEEVESSANSHQNEDLATAEDIMMAMRAVATLASTIKTGHFTRDIRQLVKPWMAAGGLLMKRWIELLSLMTVSILFSPRFPF